MKSTIGIDNGKSIAYIDDFEGAKKTIPFGVSYGTWHYMSPPAYQEGVDSSQDVSTALPDTDKDVIQRQKRTGILSRTA